MSEQNITKLIKSIHEQEVHKEILSEVQEEIEPGVPEDLLAEVRALVEKATNSKPNVIAFPNQNIQLGETPLMAASGQNLGEWFAQPIVFAASGFVVDIRKVLGSGNEVDVYIYPNGSDETSIEKTLLPFKDKSLRVRFSVNETELLTADIYVDDSGHAAEGSGQLSSIKSEDVHGKLNFEVIVKE